MYRPTLKSYFSGAGLGDYGFSQAGCEVIQSLEYDTAACDTLRKNFSHNVVSEDIRQVAVLKQPKSDIVALSFPCTRYSTIANISGTNTGDMGDSLFLHAFRHIALELPEAFMVENVPGFRKYPIPMECFTKIPGYYISVFCPVNATNWLPQERKRLIVFGTRKPLWITPPTFLRKVHLKDIIEKDAQVEMPDYVYNRLNGKYRDLPIISDPEKGDIAPTCVAHYAKDLSTRMVKVGKSVRPWSVKEYSRLQGVPDSFEFCGGDRAAYKQIGNGIPVPLARWMGEQMMRYFNTNRDYSMAA